MGIGNARLHGKIKLRGKPREMAKAEIMIMREREKQEGRKRRRILFTFLDFVIIISFGLSIYSLYIQNYLNVVLFLVVASLPLIYFIVRRALKNKHKK